VTIPSSVASIGFDAFYHCNSLESVNIEDIALWCAIDFSSYDSSPLHYANNLYLNGILVTELVIPEGVTVISEYAFADCTCITSVIIPESVTSIEYYAFKSCTALTSIKYRGSEEAWNNIYLLTSWDTGTDNYTIIYNYTGN
jgi:hypothetical protein